jgi:hypothetical protein
MDKNEFKQYLANKDKFWKRVLRNFFLLRKDLYKYTSPDDIDEDFVFENESESGLIDLVDFVNYMYEDTKSLAEMYYDEYPVCWQTDFVKSVAKKSQLHIADCSSIYSLVDSVCIALSDAEIQLDDLVKQLNNKYGEIFTATNKKFALLRRNMQLATETFLGEIPEKSPKFGKMLDYYIPKFGRDRIIKVLQHATTKDLFLSETENECLSFAYHSPCSDEIYPDTEPDRFSGGIFKLTEDYLQRIDRYCHQKVPADYEKVMSFPVYTDVFEFCMIDARYRQQTYAHVYIEKSASKLNNLLNEFIVYHNDFLYTVEIVDSLEDLEIFKHLQPLLYAAKKDYAYLIEEYKNNHELIKDADFMKKISKAIARLNSCYCIPYF